MDGLYRGPSDSGSWTGVPRWSSVAGVAAGIAAAVAEMTMLPRDRKSFSCQSTCAYRSFARWRLSSSAASTRFYR